MVQFRATVEVNLEDIAVSCFYSVIGAVVTLPPSSTSCRALAEAVIVPGVQNISNLVFTVVKAKRNGDLDFAFRGNLNLPADKLWSHYFILSPAIVSRSIRRIITFNLKYFREDMISFEKR